MYGGSTEGRDRHEQLRRAADIPAVAGGDSLSGQLRIRLNHGGSRSSVAYNSPAARYSSPLVSDFPLTFVLRMWSHVQLSDLTLALTRLHKRIGIAPTRQELSNVNEQVG